MSTNYAYIFYEPLSLDTISLYILYVNDELWCKYFITIITYITIFSDCFTKTT